LTCVVQVAGGGGSSIGDSQVVDSPPDTFEITVIAVANLPQGPTARSTTYLLTIGPPAA
jgi:hypothetical protein